MTELLHWIAHLICAFLGVASVIYIDDLRKQLTREKQHRPSDATRQFVIPEELAKAHEKKGKRVRKGKGGVKVELVKG